MRAFHIESAQGKLAAVYHVPETGQAHVRDVLFLHGFAHELTIARAVMASVWRRLASEGTGVLSLDLPGCGDSAGDFGDASWDWWRSAAETAYGWLAGHGGRSLHLAGLRIGAGVALEIAGRVRPRSLMLFQPLIRGEEMMTQFLRLRVAFSGLRGEVAERETTQRLRQRMEAGEKLEIGGFILAPELALAIDRFDIQMCRPPADCPVHWIETGKGELSEAVQKTAGSWRGGGAAVCVTQVDVKPYWVHTRGMVPEYGALAEEVARILR